MNVRAVTVFFWGFLVASAALASEEYRSELKIAVETDGNARETRKVKVIKTDDSVGSDLSVAGQLHGEHKVIIRKEVEKTTN